MKPSKHRRRTRAVKTLIVIKHLAIQMRRPLAF
jgi:hypothetical protein